jgi:hypothetical protein
MLVIVVLAAFCDKESMQFDYGEKGMKHFVVVKAKEGLKVQIF